MGVVTGTLFKGLNFGGIDSRDYGVYITGEAVYNAPVRDVEMINVPGRNGAYPLDRGRFENITVTYPAGMMEGTAADFAANISDFRNALAALTGYQRLTDDYNPNEYRQAVYTGGLEVEAATGHNAGEFEIVFTCKPQRFLTAGEQAVTVTSGDELDNPTLFSSHPLLQVYGYGDLNIGDDTITITDTPIGAYTIANSQMITGRYVIQNVGALLNTGDSFRVSGGYLDFEIKGADGYRVNLNTVSFDPSTTDTTAAILSTPTAWSFIARVSSASDYAFTKGTSSTRTVTTGFSCDYYPTDYPASTATVDGTAGIKMTYDADADTLEIWRYAVYTGTTNVIGTAIAQNTGTITGDSSKGSLGAPLYFDLDLGEAYKYESGNVVSVNSAVSFGAELPELPPGETVITFDNTVTQLQIVPRWWRL